MTKIITNSYNFTIITRIIICNKPYDYTIQNYIIYKIVDNIPIQILSRAMNVLILLSAFRFI